MHLLGHLTLNSLNLLARKLTKSEVVRRIFWEVVENHGRNNIYNSIKTIKMSKSVSLGTPPHGKDGCTLDFLSFHFARTLSNIQDRTPAQIRTHHHRRRRHHHHHHHHRRRRRRHHHHHHRRRRRRHHHHHHHRRRRRRHHHHHRRRRRRLLHLALQCYASLRLLVMSIGWILRLIVGFIVWHFQHPIDHENVQIADCSAQFVLSSLEFQQLHESVFCCPFINRHLPAHVSRCVYQVFVPEESVRVFARARVCMCVWVCVCVCLRACVFVCAWVNWIWLVIQSGVL